jgi:hypothetical protein
MTCRPATTWRKDVTMGASPWNTIGSREPAVKSTMGSRPWLQPFVPSGLRHHLNHFSGSSDVERT